MGKNQEHFCKGTSSSHQLGLLNGQSLWQEKSAFLNTFFLSVFDCHALSLQKANASKSLKGWPTPSLPPARTHTHPYPLLSIYPNASFFHPEITACLWQLEMSHRCVSHHSWSLAVHPGTHEHMRCAQSAQFCFLHSTWQIGSTSNICMCVRNCLAIYLALFLQSIIACPLRRRKKVQVQNSFELSKHILSPELLKHATSWKINHSDNIWHLQINHKMTFSFIRWSIFRWRWSTD